MFFKSNLSKKIKVVTCIILVTWLFPLHAKNITLVADPWCPFNCQDSDAKKGYMIEIADLIFSRHNITVKYINVPWSRAIKEVVNGNFHGLVGVGKEEVPGLIFPSINQGVAVNAFYTLANSTWFYQDITSLNGKKLGVIQDYSYGSFDQEYIAAYKDDRNKIEYVTGIDGLTRNIDKMLNNRINVLIEDRNVFNHAVANRASAFREAGTISEEEVFIAFSPNRPDSQLLSEILTKGMKEIRASGELAKILARYHLKDWQKPLLK